uniref:Uncharacterized protein n=1 Tax=Plectus sambesii TaxID=2011161 RepID=A0A914VI40_9BILA
MLQNGNTSNSLHLAPITTLKEAHVDTRRKTFCGTVVTKRPMTVYEMNGNECFRFHFHMNDAGDETVIARIVAFDESAKKWDSYITEGQKYIVSKLNSQPLPDKYKSAELTEDFQLVIERYSIIELCPTKSSVPISNASAPTSAAARKLSAAVIASEVSNLAQVLGITSLPTTPPDSASVTPPKSGRKRKTETPTKSPKISVADKKHNAERKRIYESVRDALDKVDPESIHRVSRDLQDVCTRYIDEYNEKKRRLSDQPSTSP